MLILTFCYNLTDTINAMIFDERIKMFKRFASVLFCIGMFCAAKSVSAATSSIMLNADDGSVMYETNADAVRYPASLTKLMTLYITFNALENGRLKLSDKLKVSRVAASRSPSKLGVRAGETITVDNAIKAVIIKSANDCATVLAEHFSKSEAEFAVLMTQTAQKLGMKHTVFKNASGLPNSQQKTTARDMSKLAMAVYHHFPQYYKWFSAKSFKYKGQTITGHNHLLDTFSGADGMKTGYTAASGYNIITSAKRSGKRVIAVTMGHRYMNERDKKVAVMMDKGLIELKKSGKVDVAALERAIDGNQKTTVYAQSKVKTPNKSNNVNVASAIIPQSPAKAVANGKYALQVGAFSDYKRAKNYAMSVKNNLVKRYAVYNIKVEKVQTGNGTMYRSKVVGLAKNTANQICQNMKKQNKNCLVVADNSAMNLAQK